MQLSFHKIHLYIQLQSEYLLSNFIFIERFFVTCYKSDCRTLQVYGLIV